tara:strand:+ start:9589 stop:9963 length:375 start_codon:yes stop_codon:yes gene_type:complete
VVAEYISSIKAAWDLARILKTATDSIDDAQIKLQMAELISALADAKIEAAENAEKLTELQRELNARSSLIYEKGLYYEQDEEDYSLDGPFCPTCYDSESKIIRLREFQNERSSWRCNVCCHVFD